MNYGMIFVHGFPMLEQQPQLECWNSSKEKYLPCPAKQFCDSEGQYAPGTIKNLITDFNLICSDDQVFLASFNSAFFFSFFIGLCFFNVMGDIYGRKRIVTTVFGMAILCWFTLLFAQNKYMLLILAVFGGFFTSNY